MRIEKIHFPMISGNDRERTMKYVIDRHPIARMYEYIPSILHTSKDGTQWWSAPEIIVHLLAKQDK